MADAAKREFALEDLYRVIPSLEAQGHSCILIGGQAVNYWVSRFQEQEPILKKMAGLFPLVSKDIDFQGNLSSAKALARCLGRRLETPSFREAFGNLLSGIIRYDLEGFPLHIEILREIPGLTARDLERAALLEQYSDSTIRVLNPIAMLMAKAWNVRHIRKEGRRDKEQLLLLIPCVRAFLKLLLGRQQKTGPPLRGLLNLIKTLLRFTEESTARKCSEICGVNWLSALPLSDLEARTEPEFIRLREMRLPLWRQKIGRYKIGVPQSPIQRRLLEIIAETQ